MIKKLLQMEKERIFLTQQLICMLPPLALKVLGYLINWQKYESIKYFSKQMTSFMHITEEELEIIKRARNHKSISHPRNCDIVTYKYATGLEALIGYLYLSGNNKRIDEIMNYILR